MLRQILGLIRFEAKTELARWQTLGGVLLYVLSSVYVSYLCFLQTLNPQAWNALFWIIILFASVQGTAKSFIGETRGRTLYYFFLINPTAFILGRIFYNTLLLWVLGFLCIGVFIILNGNPIQNFALFITCFVLGAMGLSAVFTLVSAIAARAGNNFTLMSVLSFPIVLPLLLIVIRLTNFAISGMDFSDSYRYLLSLLCLDLLVVSLSYYLFQYLWKE